MVINVHTLTRGRYLEVTRHPENAAVPWHITAGMQVDLMHVLRAKINCYLHKPLGR